MQTALVFVIWIIFSLLMQTVVLSDFPSVRVWSDLLFYLVIILGLRYSFVAGVALSCLLGYIADAFSLAPFGTSIISYVVTLLFIRKVMANIYLENKLSLFVWVVIFSLMRQVIQLLIFKMNYDEYAFNLFTLVTMMLQSAWDGFLGLFILPFLEKALFTDWSKVFRKKGLRN